MTPCIRALVRIDVVALGLLLLARSIGVLVNGLLLGVVTESELERLKLSHVEMLANRSLGRLKLL